MTTLLPGLSLNAMNQLLFIIILKLGPFDNLGRVGSRAAQA
jgi:hypothetical protein